MECHHSMCISSSDDVNCISPSARKQCGRQMQKWRADGSCEREELIEFVFICDGKVQIIEMAKCKCYLMD